MAVVKVEFKPESVSISFIKYANYAIFENIEKPCVAEFKNRVSF